MIPKPLQPDQTVDECESTNDLARLLGEQGEESGSWISARVQKKGRGRAGRSWLSMEGNLFLSMIVRSVPQASLTWIPLASAMAVVLAIRETVPAAPVRIKWPNDLWISGAKLGGILCEAVGNRTNSFIVIGVGLNCATDPGQLDQATTSLTAASGSKVTADLIRSAVVASLRRILLRLNHEGPQFLRRLYDELAVLEPGTEVRWGNPERSGAVIGLGELGELRVLADGSELSLFAEDVKIRVAG